MPSTTPLSRTASLTSSVMSRTARPPVVRSCRSCWKTFTFAHPPRCGRPRSAGGPIVRVSAASRLDQASAGGDADGARHPELLVVVHGAVHLVLAGLLEGDREGHRLAEADVGALRLDPVALDLEVVRLGSLIGRLEGVGARLRERDRAGREREVLLDDRDGRSRDARFLAEVASAAPAAAPAAPRQQRGGCSRGRDREKLPHGARAYDIPGRMDRELAAAALGFARRARSSVRSEQRTHNPLVPGSNPGGPMSFGTIERKPPSCVSQTCQPCRKCSRRPYLGAYLGIRSVGEDADTAGIIGGDLRFRRSRALHSLPLRPTSMRNICRG